MNKENIKNILMSIRNPENEHIVNYLLGQVDMKDDKSISEIAESLGNDENNIRTFLLKKIQKKQEQRNDEKYPINDMFTYGVSENCIHLHLPGDLHKKMAENGISKTISMVNLSLLDAISKIQALKAEKFYRFEGKDSIYMISPIVIKREMRFLEGLDFKTQSYSKKQLEDEKFVRENPEAGLAVHIFGKGKNIGTASIDFDTINTTEWQEKRDTAMKELREKIADRSDKTDIEK